MKGFIITAIAMLLACGSAFGQLIVSAGGNAYLGESGLMFGAGAAVEMGFAGCFTGSRDEVTSFGTGVEWFTLTTTYTDTPGSGFVMPFVAKERFLLDPTFALNIGTGGAMVLLDVDHETYSGYTVYSSIGGAIFVEAGFLSLPFKSPFVLVGNVRGGVLFIEDGIFPFFGVVLQAGYAFIFPEDEYANDY